MNRSRLARLGALTIAAVGFVAVAGPADARKPAGAYAAVATTSLGGLVGGNQVSFSVQEPLRMSLWVSNRCYQGGTVVVAENLPVVDNVAGPFTVAAGTCWAYTWAYPKAADPLPGTQVEYVVG